MAPDRRHLSTWPGSLGHDVNAPVHIHAVTAVETNRVVSEQLRQARVGRGLLAPAASTGVPSCVLRWVCRICDEATNHAGQFVRYLVLLTALPGEVSDVLAA
jgi:hypothetical protein